MMSSKTSFDKLSTEIFLHIFDYLSTNEIIYTFICLNSQFRKILLHHERYLHHFELPIENFQFYQNLLPIINDKIRILTIPTTDLSLSLDILFNLKTIIISSPYGLSDRSLQTLFSHKYFPNLRVLKIQSENYLKTRSSLLRDNFEHYFFTNIFNEHNQLEYFEYLSLIQLFSRKTLNNFQINSSLISLTLYLNEFRDIFIILRYTPNVISLNIKTILCSIHQKHDEWFNDKQIKLEKLSLTFLTKHSMQTDHFTQQTDFLHFISDIKLFSSTLIFLSMNFINLNISNIEDFPFNGLKLQHQLLESMTELKQFHLYSKVQQQSIDIENVLSTFQDPFWFDHNWSIGIHGKYLYTLPFHFNELYDFIDFNQIKSNNNRILHSSGIWSKVKLIEFARSNQFNLSLIKQIKIKFPQLNAIRFLSSGLFSYSEILNHPNLLDEEILTNISTVHLIGGSIEHIKQWLIYVLPNVKNLILSYTGLPSITSQLMTILNKKIHRLDIHEYSVIKQMIITNEIYFSNVEDIRLILHSIEGKFQWYVKTLMKILTNYKHLKTLSLCIVDDNNLQTFSSSEAELSKIIEYLKMNGIDKLYHIKRHRESVLFFK